MRYIRSIAFLALLSLLFSVGSLAASDRKPIEYQEVAQSSRSQFSRADSCLYVAKTKREYLAIVALVGEQEHSYDADRLYFFLFTGKGEEGKSAAKGAITRIWREGPLKKTAAGREEFSDIIHVEATVEDGAIVPPFLDSLSPWVCVSVKKSRFNSDLSSRTRFSLYEKRISYHRREARSPFAGN